MKKFLYSIALVFVLGLSIIFAPFFGVNLASAQQINSDEMLQNIKPVISQYLNEFVEAGEETKTRAFRLAGSQGEKLASQFISNALTELGLTPSIDYPSGVQQFDAFSNYEYKKVSSQNVVYTLKGAAGNNKKVILTTNYDNYFEGYTDGYGSAQYKEFKEGDTYSEGVNYSAAGVATLLAIAKYLPSGSLPFDVEFVFLGASGIDNAGAKHYSEALGVQARNNTLLIVDVSDIALGSNVYYYTGEFNTAASKQYSKQNMLGGIKKFNNGFAGTATESLNDMGYTTAGYSGATSVFLGQKINVLHLFSGDYTSGLFAGKREYNGKPIISGTQNDNLAYIKQNYGEDYLNNPSKAAVALCQLLYNDKFVSVHTGEVSSSAYNFYSNTTLHKIIFGLTFVAIIVASVVIYNVFYRKSYSYAFNNKLKGVMLTVDDGKNKQASSKPEDGGQAHSTKPEQQEATSTQKTDESAKNEE